MSGNHFTVIPCSYVLLRRDDEVLLIRRANTGYFDGSYALPAGHIEGNESAKTAAIREAKEEVGVTIDVADLQFAHVMHRVAEEADHERVDFFFETSKWQGEPYNAEPEKCDDIRWCKLNALPENLTPVTALALKSIAAGSQYSDQNFKPA